MAKLDEIGRKHSEISCRLSEFVWSSLRSSGPGVRDTAAIMSATNFALSKPRCGVPKKTLVARVVAFSVCQPCFFEVGAGAFCERWE